jgi:hypothetical protein
MPRCVFTPRADGLALSSPYDAGFVAQFKMAVPANARAWDKTSKVWVIDASHAGPVADLCARYFGERPAVPAIQAGAARPEIRVIRLEYLGQCKRRDDGAITATGYAEGAWTVIAPEPVLRRWFEGPGPSVSELGMARPETYYGVLGVAQSADAAAIKAGYRRMARQWHPDVCAEPTAHAMFLTIQGAYNILSDPLLRKKYDAGLLFEARGSLARRERHVLHHDGYRTPLRCGLVVAEALPRLGRWELSSIHSWADITDLSGRVLVTSWDKDAERIRYEWVAP